MGQYIVTQFAVMEGRESTGQMPDANLFQMKVACGELNLYPWNHSYGESEHFEANLYFLRLS